MSNKHERLASPKGLFGMTCLDFQTIVWALTYSTVVHLHQPEPSNRLHKFLKPRFESPTTSRQTAPKCILFLVSVELSRIIIQLGYFAVRQGARVYLAPVAYLQDPVSHSVENIRCGGNDLPLGFYAAERNGLSGDRMFVLCGEEDHNFLC